MVLKYTIDPSVDEPIMLIDKHIGFDSEDGDGVNDGYDTDVDGDIDEYFEHRNCQHTWGDADGDGFEECQICGLLRSESGE
jgi:hypothetical protein